MKCSLLSVIYFSLVREADWTKKFPIIQAADVAAFNTAYAVVY
jgi:hypothetical protein